MSHYEGKSLVPLVEPSSFSAAGGPKLPIQDDFTEPPTAIDELGRPESNLHREQSVAELLGQANQDIATLRLTSPPKDNALERLNAVNLRDPDNPQVQLMLQKIFSYYIDSAQLAQDAGNPERANELLRMAELVLFGQ